MVSNNIWNSTMQNGLILGIIFSANFIFSVSAISILAILSFLAPAVITILAYKYLVKYRDIDCNGAISYSHALFYTILLFFFASLISAAVKFIYFRFINPDFLQKSLNQSMITLDQMTQMMQGRFPVDKEQSYEMLKTMADPLNYTLMLTWTNVFIGLFVALFLAGIAKKQKSIFDKDQNNLPQE